MPESYIDQIVKISYRFDKCFNLNGWNVCLNFSRFFSSTSTSTILHHSKSILRIELVMSTHMGFNGAVNFVEHVLPVITVFYPDQMKKKKNMEKLTNFQ